MRIQILILGIKGLKKLKGGPARKVGCVVLFVITGLPLRAGCWGPGGRAPEWIIPCYDRKAFFDRQIIHMFITFSCAQRPHWSDSELMILDLMVPCFSWWAKNGFNFMFDGKDLLFLRISAQLIWGYVTWMRGGTMHKTTYKGHEGWSWIMW